MRRLASLDWSLAHFALLGLVLFAGSHWLAAGDASGVAGDARIVVSRAQVDAWSRQYEAVTGKSADDAVRAAFVARYVDEEMLYRESRVWGLASDNQAIDLRLRQKMAFVGDADMADDELLDEAVALGLDADDAVIRNMLAHNMRLLLSRSGEQEPNDEQLRAFYERERERFASPVRFSGRQVYFPATAEPSALAAARAAQRRLATEGLDPEAAIGLGESGPFAPRFKGQLAHQLTARFGEAFAKVVEGLREGQWSEPVTTPFGVHLVYLEERVPPRVPPFAAIRARVAAVYQASERDKRLAAAMDDLRARYEVVIE